jgi:hypothetical protein
MRPAGFADSATLDSPLFRGMAEDIRAQAERAAAARALIDANVPLWRGCPITELSREELIEAITYQHRCLNEIVARAARERLQEIAVQLGDRIAAALLDEL